MSASLAIGLATLIHYICQSLMFLIIASVVISWLDANPTNPLVKGIQSVSELIYKPLRPLTNRIPVPLDLAPMFAVFIIIFVESTLVHWLKQFAYAG